MEKINVSTLREHLATYLNKAKNGQVITITSHGHELAKIIPAGKKSENSQKKLIKLGKTAIINDILSPIDEDWDTLK